MLATGGSAVQALTVLKQNGAIHPALICIVSSPEGVAEVESQHPGTVIHTAAHDRALNAKNTSSPASEISATASTAREPASKR